MEWSEFARRLGRELAGLERDTILIVRERDESRHYVQAMREPERLYAEAVSNNFLEGPLLLTLADEEVMSDAGWRPPADPAPRNWWTELPGHATVAEHDRLADVMVTALRDVQGVRRPSDLVYESFHRHGTGLIELLDFGIEAADPSRITRARRTSLELADDPGGVPASSVIGPPAARQFPGGPSSTGPLQPGPLQPGPSSTGPIPTDTPPYGTPAHGTPPHGDPAAGVPALAAPVPEPGPGFGAEPPVPEGPDPLEPRLADAKSRGDQTTYFELLLAADLVLPATGPAVEDPEAAEFPTAVIAGATCVVVFTSPHALARSGHLPGLYRRTSFIRLAESWPDPAWQLAVNPGLPSEVHLDTTAVARLDATQRALGRSQPVPPPAASSSGGQPPVPPAGHPTAPPPADPTASPSGPGPSPAAPPPAPRSAAPAGPTGPADGPAVASAVPLSPPHGTRLWTWDGEGDEMESAVPAAVFDAISGSWAPVRADAVQARRTD